MSGVAVPAPTGGWNSRDSLAEMPITDAVALENIVPNGDSLKGRPGYAVHSNELISAFITNGDFAADSDWTKGTGWTIAAGVASSDGSQVGDSDLTQAINPVNGVSYSVTFTVSGYSAGNVCAVVGDTEGTDRSADGTYTETIVAGAGTDIDIRADLDFVGNIDNVSVSLLSTAVETLVTYHGSTSQTLMAAAGGRIIDISAGGNGTTLAGGFAEDRWHTCEFKNRIIFCNEGTDGVQDWDGTTWTATSISGATSADLVHCTNFKGRIFYVKKNSQNFYYMGAGSYAGAATEFDLSQQTLTGGYLLYVIDWTMDGGAGVDDYAVFVFSTGEILVYAGSDPGSSTDWAMLGRFRIGAPLGRKSATQIGGDVIILTVDGYVPLSAALAEGRYSEQSNFSFKIDPDAKRAAQTYGSNFGWESIHWPQASWFLVNVPISATESVQHVRSTVKGAWCKLTGLDASCWAVYNDNLYFGTPDGYVYQIGGTSDLGAFIPFRAIQAFNYFGSAHNKKQVTAVEVITNFAYPKYIDSKIHADHNIKTLGPYDEPPEGAVSEWNVGEWNVAEWSGGGAPGSKVSRKNITGTGYALAHEVRWKSRAQSVIWYATHFFIKPMGIV